MVLNTVSINLICILVAKKVIAFFKVIAERQGIKLAEEKLEGVLLIMMMRRMTIIMIKMVSMVLTVGMRDPL